MELKEGSVLYARIDYKDGNPIETEQDGMDCMEYYQNLAKDRYIMAGIFGDMELGHMDGAMILFEAKDLAEAKEITENDPIIKRGFYEYKLYKWNLMMLPK